MDPKLNLKKARKSKSSLVKKSKGNIFKRRTNVKRYSKPKDRVKRNEDETSTHPSNIEQSSDIYRLPIELMADIFDYLQIYDLGNVCQTSKWFQQVAGYCYTQNYSAFQTLCESKESEEMIFTHHYGERLFAFDKLIQKISVQGIGRYQRFLEKQLKYQQLKSLDLFGINLTNVGVEEQQNPKMSTKLEMLRMNSCKMGKNFIENLPVLFPNLKRLIIEKSDIKSDWINYKYPTLERFQLLSDDIVMVTPFLKLNPNIRKLEINAQLLLNNKDSIQTEAIKVDDLAVWIEDEIVYGGKFESVCLIFNELYELGAYKRLKLHRYLQFNQDMVDKLSSVHGLIKLYSGSVIHIMGVREGVFCNWSERIALSALQNLVELHAQHSYDIVDSEALAANGNLERIHFAAANFDDLMPFIRKAKNLEKIKIDAIFHADHITKTRDAIIYAPKTSMSCTINWDDTQSPINLRFLNAERAKLVHATKIIIYVKEEVYLTTKWATGQTDLEFIQLKRASSYDWDNDFIV